MKTLVLAVAIALLGSVAFAGGSWESVKVESLTLLNSTDYELVVVPEQSRSEYKDPYMGNCARFIVKGSYSWLHSWRFREDVTRENHKAALAYIQQAQTTRMPILLGWMGTGFVATDPTNQCVVRSRALQLLTEQGQTAVISYHNAV